MTWNRQSEMKQAYILMKLDVMLAQHQSIGVIDLNDLHEFIAQFRHLGRKRQKMYAFMVDEIAELWDAHDAMDYDV